jgi:hypothetical protein
VRAELREALAGVRAELGEKFAVELGAVRADLRDANAERRTEMAAFRTELLRCTFLFWIGTMGTVLALLKL